MATLIRRAFPEPQEKAMFVPLLASSVHLRGKYICIIPLSKASHDLLLKQEAGLEGVTLGEQVANCVNSSDDGRLCVRSDCCVALEDFNTQ